MPSPFVDEREVLLAPNHTVAGNPSRFKSGLVQLRDDRDWRTALGDADRLLTTTISMPLLHHYGYSIRSKVG